jgi:DNA-binding FadR family transcriptional regulator
VAGGSFVAHPSAEQLSDTLATGVRLMQATAVVDAAHLLEVRSLLEVAATGYAAQRHQPQHLDVLRQALFDPHTADVETMVERHPVFHRALLAACANPVLELISAPLHAVVNIRELVAGLGQDFWVRVDADHREILDAVTARDAEAAETAATKHLDHLRETFVA